MEDRFTIGRVLALSARSFGRHPLIILMLALIGGAGSEVPLILCFAGFAGFCSILAFHPVIHDAVLASVRALVFAPVALITLHSLAADRPNTVTVFREALHRVGYVVVVAILIQLVGGTPQYLIDSWRDVSGAARWSAGVAKLVYQALFLTIANIWMVALVAEPLGMAQALRRSLGLLSGRWPHMFALVLLTYALSMPLQWIEDYGDRMSQRTFDVRPRLIARSGASSGRIIVVCLISSVAFYLLRREKDGSPPERTAPVFD